MKIQWLPIALGFIFALITVGCGRSGDNRMVVPELDDQSQQQIYDDYDKQQESASVDYQ